MRHLHGRDDEIPVTEDHRRAGPAEQRRGTEEAGHRQDAHHERPARRHVQCLQHQCRRAGCARTHDNRRPHRRQRPADGRPVDDDCDLDHRQSRERRAAERRHLLDPPECKRHGDQNRGQPGVEPEKLHAGLTRNEQQREDDPDGEVSEEKVEDHVRGRERREGGKGRRILPSLRSGPDQRSRLLISAQFTTFHQASM